MHPSQFIFLGKCYGGVSIYKYMGFLIDINIYDAFLDFYFRTSIFKSFVLL